VCVPSYKSLTVPALPKYEQGDEQEPENPAVNEDKVVDGLYNVKVFNCSG
jgi:hypothetical protein